MSGFLKSLSHTSKVSLGPKDLQPLQNLISAEKRVGESSARSSAEVTKAASALKEWANTEGPDLADIVTKVGILFDYLSGAEKRYSEHHENYRQALYCQFIPLHFKNIRTQEEDLAQLKRNRDSLGSKIEAQDRKVSRMKEENKDLPAAMQRLSEMRQEMAGLEHAVLNEEAALGDKKRQVTKIAMSLRLGALLEWAEKAVVVAELGKLIVDEIPTDKTEPGAQRSPYNGYQKTDDLMQQAQKCISDVVFNPQPLQDQYGAAAHNAGAEHGGQYWQEQQAPDGHEGSAAAYGGATYGEPTGSHQQSQAHPGFHPNEQSYRSQHSDYHHDSYRQKPQLPEIVSSGPMSGVDGASGYDSAQHGRQDGTRTPASTASHGAYNQAGTYGLAAAALAPAVGSATKATNSTTGQDSSANAANATNPTSLSTPAYMQNRSSLAYMEEDPNARTAWQSEQAARERQQASTTEVPASAGGMSSYEREARQAFETEQREQQQQQQHHQDQAGAVTGRRSFENNIGGTNLSPVAENPTERPSLDKELAEAQETERADLERRGQDKVAAMNAPYQESSSAGPPYAAGPPRYGQYPADSSEQSFVRSEGAEAYPTTRGTMPPGAAPAEHSSSVSRVPPPRIMTATPPPGALNTVLPVSPAVQSETPLSPAAGTPTAKSPRQPVMIRGESALGSKYGDVFVPNRAAIDGGALNTLSNPSTPPVGGSYSPNIVNGGQQQASSGYFRAGPEQVDSQGRKVISAGAFQQRRPNNNEFYDQQPQPRSSGYGVSNTLGSPRFGSAVEGGQTQADVIRQEYLSAQVRAMGGEGQEPTDVMGPGGAPSPRFDVSPLHVNKSKQPSRPGSVPPGAEGGYAAPAPIRGSYGTPPPQPAREYQPLLDSGRPASVKASSIGGGANNNGHAYGNMAGIGAGQASTLSGSSARPPSYVAPPSTEMDPTSATRSAGFGQQQFVTRLD
ncbi:hypothetical protein OIV83_005332 [Microbotryomycetes sp. JL201]|nr:hypothetical protein OIV83_005332 [Microbotryomycetes sp. JL201]